MTNDTRGRRATMAPAALLGGGAAAGDAEPQFTRYREIAKCPRCQSDTRHREACPVCLLEINDDVVAEAEAREQRVNTRRLITAAFLVALTFVQIEGIAVGFAMGKNSVGVSQQAVERASEAETKRVFRSMDRATRLRHQAAQLQNLFNGELLPAYKIRFTRRQLKDQPPPPARDSMNVDVTYVAATDAQWRQLSQDERQIMVAGLAQSHARFLALAGAADTARFAAVISVYDPGTTDTDHERILALRDRNGRILVR